MTKNLNKSIFILEMDLLKRIEELEAENARLREKLENFSKACQSCGLYLIYLGTYEELKTKFTSADFVKIKELEPGPNRYFYKFGKTNNWKRRLAQHTEDFGKLGIRLTKDSLRKFHVCEEVNLTDKENKIFSHLYANRGIFAEKDIFKNNRKEVVVLTDDQVDLLVKSCYS